MLVTGTGPMGCVPAELAQRSRTGECAVELQRAASLFNPQLTQLLSDLNSQLAADVFVAANTYAMHMDFVSNPQAYGNLNKHQITYFYVIYIFLYIEMLKTRKLQAKLNSKNI